MKVHSPFATTTGHASARLTPPPDFSGNRFDLGILSNGKPNATPFLSILGGLVASRYGLRAPLLLDKKITPEPEGEARGSTIDKLSGAPRWMLDRLSSGSLAVIVGDGD